MRCKGVYCVDLGESFQMSIYLQKSASIQKRTSSVKFARSPCTDPPGGFSEDDIILECVMLVGTIAMDQYAAPLIAASQLVKVLNELLAEKQEDDEIVLQLIFTFHCLLMCPETRDVILDESPEVVRFIMDLLMDKNSAIRTQAN